MITTLVNTQKQKATQGGSGETLICIEYSVSYNTYNNSPNGLRSQMSIPGMVKLIFVFMIV